MKKIILISDGWRRLVTYAWVAGIMREIRKRDLDIALYQYNDLRVKRYSSKDTL